jgi:hypothetical protein
MVHYLAFLHLFWGVILFVYPPVGVDASGGATWNIYVRFLGYEFWRVWFIAGSLCAEAALLAPARRWWTMLLLIPQQITCTVAMLGVFTNFAGTWDTFAVSRCFRQTPTAMGPFVFHTLSVLDLELNRGN